MVQHGPNDHFGQNDLIPNRILAFARPKWTKIVHFGPFWPEEVHFGPFRSANRTLAIPDSRACMNLCSSAPKSQIAIAAIFLRRDQIERNSAEKERDFRSKIA